MNKENGQSQQKEPSLQWNAKLAIYIALLGLLIASCTPAQATETQFSPTSPIDVNPTPTLAFTPEAEPTQEIAEPTLETFETLDQILESFKIGEVDLKKPTTAVIPSHVWELLAKNKTGIDKSGEHELLITEPHVLTGANWLDPANQDAIDSFNANEFTAWLPSNPLEQWHVGLLLDTNVPGHNATINHAFWKKSFGEIGFYAGSADPETQAALIGTAFEVHNNGNEDETVNAKILAITTIPAAQYENWTTGPAGNIQADLYQMGIPADVLSIQDSNIIHIFTCMPAPGTEYDPNNPEANTAWRAIVSLELTP